MEYEGAIGPDGYLGNDARNAFARAVRFDVYKRKGSTLQLPIASLDGKGTEIERRIF